MIRLAHTGTRATLAPRRWLLLTAIAWLNIAIAPCAMAFGDVSPTCPHTAAPAHAEMMSHEGHHDAQSGSDCALVESDCCGDQNVAADSRSHISVDKQLNADLLFCTMPDASCPVSTVSGIFFDVGPPDRFVTSRPIHVLNCVYLD